MPKHRFVLASVALWPLQAPLRALHGSRACQPIGRIRLARERSPAIWLWHVTVTIPGPPFGDARTIDEAKQRFKAEWLAFKDGDGSREPGRSISAVKLSQHAVAAAWG